MSAYRTHHVCICIHIIGIYTLYSRGESKQNAHFGTQKQMCATLTPRAREPWGAAPRVGCFGIYCVWLGPRTAMMMCGFWWEHTLRRRTLHGSCINTNTCRNKHNYPTQKPRERWLMALSTARTRALQSYIWAVTRRRKWINVLRTSPSVDHLSHYPAFLP